MAELRPCVRGFVLDMSVVILMIGVYLMIFDPANNAYAKGVPYSDKDLEEWRRQEKEHRWKVVVAVNVTILAVIKPMYIAYTGWSERQAGGPRKAQPALRRYASLQVKMFFAYLLVYLVGTIIVLALNQPPERVTAGTANSWEVLTHTFLLMFLVHIPLIYGGVILLIFTVALLLYPAMFALLVAHLYGAPSLPEDGRQGLVEMEEGVTLR